MAPADCPRDASLFGAQLSASPQATPRSETSARGPPSGTALRRSPRYSPYRAGMSYTSTSQPSTRPSEATRRVEFSPQPPSSTPSRPPRSLALVRRSQPSPVKTGRPWDEIWQHYDVERENGKKHGRCKYCGILKKNGKPSGNLLNHLIKGKQRRNVPAHVVVSLRPATSAMQPRPKRQELKLNSRPYQTN
ncbi:hypothetical protein PPTG_19637 [Phytophthora nicotianae INRA-310]|uniref:BED-type domain-containing protein n=1 Tax=Phytophthora nicotianae (strain INRA-310) TaxID=761204 RepID=W2PBI9_PHYN3|nr:hypothetical protein PPTG_19637 [Phytophthora nicotianae INRA-310]ETM98407.1 hypothetical protein PPTG_19637 [Phytophthora nicotianae INRA-310]